MAKNNKNEKSDYLKLALIQTTVDSNVAWFEPNINMSNLSSQMVWAEIRKGFSIIRDNGMNPQIVILPELTLPLDRENTLRTYACSSNSVVISGLDFRRIGSSVKNQGIIIVPNNWPNNNYSSYGSSIYYFGKTFFSYVEKKYIKDLNDKYKKDYPNGLKELPDPTMYIINAGIYGNIGIAICSDFFDLERFVLYRGQIQHMLVIAYNIDTSAFGFLSEAISRLVYCNVIVCNTGYYGSSLVFSPYKDNAKRFIYKHEGAKLFNVQEVDIPVKALIDAQNGKEDKNRIFKSKPPGYNIHLSRINRDIKL